VGEEALVGADSAVKLQPENTSAADSRSNIIFFIPFLLHLLAEHPPHREDAINYA
jgi:hypothetical protein